MRRIKKLLCQNFNCLSAIYVKLDQKPKRGKSKNEKGKLIREFFLADHESDAKTVWKSLQGK